MSVTYSPFTLTYIILLHNDQHHLFIPTNMKHGRSPNLPCIAPCMLCLRSPNVGASGQAHSASSSRAGRALSLFVRPNSIEPNTTQVKNQKDPKLHNLRHFINEVKQSWAFLITYYCTNVSSDLRSIHLSLK